MTSKALPGGGEFELYPGGVGIKCQVSNDFLFFGQTAINTYLDKMEEI